MEDKITVHIADDHQILIDGVKAVLNLEPQIEVTGFSLNGNEVVEWFKENQADVLVLDIIRGRQQRRVRRPIEGP